jgi:archaellum component FlaC
VKNILYVCLNMSLYGYGYRYPRRARKAYIGEENAEKWARAAIFNTAVANKNPWVEFLRSKKFYDELRDKLGKLRIEYYSKYPFTSSALAQKKLNQLKRQLESLNEEYDVVKSKAPLLSDDYSTTTVATKLPYSEAVDITSKKLQNQISNINARIAELEAVKDQLLKAKK